MKVLVVASEPVDAEVVDSVADDTIDEVRVIAPTLTGSALRYWMNDTDAALERAQEVVDESLAELAGSGLEASADAPTDDEPAITIDDAVRTFDPDQILVLKHSPGDEAYRESGLVEEIAEVTDVPIDVREVASDIEG